MQECTIGGRALLRPRNPEGEGVTCALLKDQRAVNRRDIELLTAGGAAGPEDLDAVHVVGLSQTKVDARVVAGKIAVGAEAEGQTGGAACFEGDAGADGVALAGDGKHLEPVVAAGGGGVVAKDADAVVEVHADKIDRAAIEQVGERQRAMHFEPSGERAGLGGDVGEMPLSVAFEEEIGFGKAVPEGPALGLGPDRPLGDTAVGHGQVEVAVVVEVEEPAAPAGEGSVNRAHAG